MEGENMVQSNVEESNQYWGTCSEGKPDDYCQVISKLVIYYDKRAKLYKKYYYTFAMMRIVLIAAISVSSAFSLLLPYSSAILSACALVAECLLGITCAQDKWKSYRRTCDKLCAEHRLYHAYAGEYMDRECAFERFVVNCEKIIRDEGERWEEYVTQIKVGVDQ